MKIISDKEINKMYVQNVCMAFFHGMKFADDSDNNILAIDYDIDDKKITVDICININGDCLNKKKEFLINSDNCVRIVNIAVGNVIYSLLSEYTKKTLEWGLLAGIRPSKLVIEQLDKSGDDEILRKN